MNRRQLVQWLGTAGTVGLAASAAPILHADDHHAGDHHAGDQSQPQMPPIQNIHLHFCGIHAAKSNPKRQIITQHYCSPINDEMHQCLLYDSVEKNARLLGVEYIISDRMYRELPLEEKRYWHPHTYEVLAGGLIGPNMSADEELGFMKYILTTWGKTWHTWPDPSTSVPMGEPTLMWSLTADDQVDSRVLADRDRQFGVSAKALRELRTQEIGFEPPQIPYPTSRDQVGRQWTATGDDRPSKHR